MKKTSLLLAILLIISLMAGCGGGGGGSTPTAGTVTGTITSDTTPLSVKSTTNDPVNIVPYKHYNFAASTMPNEKIVTFRPGLSNTEIENIIQSIGGKVKHKIYGTDNTYVINIDTVRFSTSSVQNNPNIQSIEDNIICYATKVPNDPYYATDQIWNYSMMYLPQAWDYNTGNSSIIVAVIDTGVSLNNPDLKGNLVQGYNFVENNSEPSDTTYLNEENRYSHGTHVAGIISACTNNGLGTAGVAWNVKIMPIRVLDNNGSGTLDAITSGINYARIHGAKVINLSLGAQGVSASEPSTTSCRKAIDDAINAGITVVAAAGNFNSSVAFPANYSPVIAVSALGPDGLKASYSNYGPEIYVSAPGGAGIINNAHTDAICSISYDKLNHQDCIVWMCGTSQACPHISGLVSLLYSKGMTDPAQIRTRLRTNVIDKGAPGKDDIYGYGMPKADDVISGAPFGLSVVKVFWGLPDGTMGSLNDVDGLGNYIMSSLQPGQKFICAFLDKNCNSKVDTGDRFGFQSVTVQAGVTSTVNITISTVPAGVSNVSISDYLKQVLH